MISKWSEPDNKGNLSQRVLDRVRPAVPLKNKIDMAQRDLQKHISKLDAVHSKLRARDQDMMRIIVESQRRNDLHTAKAYAYELTNLRKTIKIIGGAKLAFEQVKLRLDTVSSMGDIVVTLSPCMSVIKGLSPMISGIVPEADASMHDLTSMLGSMLNESSVSHTGELVPPVQLGGEANAIMEQANAMVAGEVSKIIPKVPDVLSQQSAPIGTRPLSADAEKSHVTHTFGTTFEPHVDAAAQLHGRLPPVPEDLKHEIVQKDRVMI